MGIEKILEQLKTIKINDFCPSAKGNDGDELRVRVNIWFSYYAAGLCRTSAGGRRIFLDEIGKRVRPIKVLICVGCPENPSGFQKVIT